MIPSKKRIGALLLSAALLCSAAGCALFSSPKEPVTVEIWHYYNGMQQQTFSQLVALYNDTVGAKENIIVTAVNQGGVNDVAQHLTESLDGEVGAASVPNAAALYADSAYAVYERGLAVDLTKYLSGSERAQYVPAYLDEGRFGNDAGLYLFPIAKSTETFLLNETDWEPFAAATGASDHAFSTWEGIVEVSRQYYEWTDAQTPDVANDGKAFFGRDAMANYLLIGSRQLGKELFSAPNGKITYQLDETVMRRLWDNYYVPAINGWFTAVGRFRSDDVKTGDCIAIVGSTSGAAYFPTAVTRADGTSYPIRCRVYPLPNFADTQPYAVQQGASMLLLKSDAAHEAATVSFLKWLTQRENALTFCLGSGYLPVTVDATAQAVTDTLNSTDAVTTDALRQSLLVGTQTAQTYQLYTSPAFAHGAEARKILENSLTDRVNSDRKQVLARVAQGASMAEAVAQFTTDASFTAWVTSLQAALDPIA